MFHIVFYNCLDSFLELSLVFTTLRVQLTRQTKPLVYGLILRVHLTVQP